MLSENQNQADLMTYRPQRPAPITITLPAAKAVLLIVDMQNDYCRPAHDAFVSDSILATIPRIQHLLDQARASDVAVFYTQQACPLDEPHIAEHPRIKEMSSEHLNGAIRGTPGSNIIDELAPRSGELVVPKGSSDPWFGTTLEKDLIRRGFDQFGHDSAFHNRVTNDCFMVVVGTESDWCVDKAVIGAYLRGFQVVVPMDCISAPTDFRQDSAIQRFEQQYLSSMTTSGQINFV